MPPNAVIPGKGLGADIQAAIHPPPLRPTTIDPVSPVRRVRAPATTRNDPDVQVTARHTVGCHEDLPIDSHESLPTGGHVMTH